MLMLLLYCKTCYNPVKGMGKGFSWCTLFCAVYSHLKGAAKDITVNVTCESWCLMCLLVFEFCIVSIVLSRAMSALEPERRIFNFNMGV